MTNRKAQPEDNAGRCESCNGANTPDQLQQAYPVLLGGGLGWGTMWLCPKCLREHEERDASSKAATAGSKP